MEDEPVPLRRWGPGSVERHGRTVRRQVRPWTPAVHALLRHLESVGFPGAPRVLGIDAVAGHEVLTYVEGVDSHHARRPELPLDAYGLEDRSGFLDLVRARQQALYDMVRQRAAAGEAGFVEIWQSTRGQRWLDDIAYLDRERATWERHLH
jgi:hypothetical protein